MRSLFLVLAAAVWMAACVNSRGPATNTTSPPEPEAWPQAYTDAVEDALNPEPDEIAHNLTAIVPDNPDLVWREVDEVSYVRMVSLVGNTSFYEGSVGTSYNTGSHYIWVTAVPELRDRCRAPTFGGGDLAMRLRQLLGLTPTSGVTAFVAFWVRPEDLFRPAADNEITDTTAGLNLPDDAEPWYRAWFNALRASQYVQSLQPRHDAYPWTQLGYTYDWGRPDAEQGVSEFVIKTSSDVMVEAIIPVATYCEKDGS